MKNKLRNILGKCEENLYTTAAITNTAGYILGCIGGEYLFDISKSFDQQETAYKLAMLGTMALSSYLALKVTNAYDKQKSNPTNCKDLSDHLSNEKQI